MRGSLGMRRRGYTLIEMLIATALAVTIMGLLGVLLGRVITANSASGQHLDDIRALGELGRQFRGDVRAAVKVSVSEPGAPKRTLSLTAADGSIVEYEISGASLQRTTAKPIAGRPARRESYLLKSMRVLDWKRQGPTGREVALTVGRVAEQFGESTAGPTFDIIAVMSPDAPVKLSP